MKKTPSCRKLILMHSFYSKPDTRQNCPFLIRYTLIPYIACLLDDMSNAEKYLQDSDGNPEVQDIDFAVILPGGLVNKPVTGKINQFAFLSRSIAKTHKLYFYRYDIYLRNHLIQKKLNLI